MKCDGSDCSHEATHFEACDGIVIFKWCDHCANYLTEDETLDTDWEIISKDEFIVRSVMAV